MKDYCSKCDKKKEGEIDSEVGWFYCYNCLGLKEEAIQVDMLRG